MHRLRGQRRKGRGAVEACGQVGGDLRGVLARRMRRRGLDGLGKPWASAFRAAMTARYSMSPTWTLRAADGRRIARRSRSGRYSRGVPARGQGRARPVGAIRGECSKHPEVVQIEDISPRAIEDLNLSVEEVNWFSHYPSTTASRSISAKAGFFCWATRRISIVRLAARDKTGIGDAINLAWKLAPSWPAWRRKPARQL